MKKKVTLPIDIAQKIATDFSQNDIKEALKISMRVYKADSIVGGDQLVRSLLYLAGGDLQLLKTELNYSRDDPRTIILHAEQANGNKGHYFSIPFNKMDRKPVAYQPVAPLNIGMSQNQFAPDYATKGGQYLFPKNWLREGQSNVIQLVLTGEVIEDVKKANQLAGFESCGVLPPCIYDIQYVWHYLDDFDPTTGQATLQLVEQAAHTRIKGMEYLCAMAQYRNYHKQGY